MKLITDILAQIHVIKRHIQTNYATNENRTFIFIIYTSRSKYDNNKRQYLVSCLICDDESERKNGLPNQINNWTEKEGRIRNYLLTVSK